MAGRTPASRPRQRATGKEGDSPPVQGVNPSAPLQTLIIYHFLPVRTPVKWSSRGRQKSAEICRNKPTVMDCGPTGVLESSNEFVLVLVLVLVVDPVV